MTIYLQGIAMAESGRLFGTATGHYDVAFFTDGVATLCQELQPQRWFTNSGNVVDLLDAWRVV